MRLLKLLILLLLILLPFGELLRFDVGNNTAIKPLDITAGLVAGWWLILLISKRIQVPRLKWYFLAFPIVGLASLLINSLWLHPAQILVSSLYLFRWISYLFVLFAVWEMDKHFKKTLGTFLFIDGLIIVLLGYFQYFFFSNLKPYFPLGWDEHMFRMFSVFLDPNFAGAFFVLYFLFVTGMFITYRKKVTRARVIGLIVILILTLCAIFLTYSRGALLMLLGGSAVFFFLIGRKKLIFGLIGLIALFILIVSPTFHTENTNLFRTRSTTARLETTENAFRIIQDHLLLGIGFNSYRYAQQEYGFRKEKTRYISHADAGVDNSFLFVTATTGIIGLAAYLLGWFTILKRAIYFYKKEQDMQSIVVIASSCGLFVSAIFINSLFFPSLLLWIWCLFGLMERKK